MTKGKKFAPTGGAVPSKGSGKTMRQQAEKTVEIAESVNPLPPEEIRQTLHELRVHQVELEIQNEELRRTQKELDALHARYFDLYDLAPVGYMTVSKHGLILEANLTAANILGVARSVLSNKPKLTRFILIEDQDIYYLHRKRLFETSEPQKCELRMVKKDGTAFWALLDATAAQDADGATVCRVVLSDITKQKLIGEALREKEVQYHHLADAGIALIWTSGTDKLCNYFNLPWLKFTGRTLEQEMGNGWAEGVHPEDLDRCVHTYVTAFDKHEPFDMEYRLRHASGEYRWIRDLGTPNYDSSGVFIGYIGHCFDITESKKAEEMLKESEEKYRLLVENAKEAIYILHDGIYLFANKICGDMLGVPPEKLIGVSMLEFLNPDDREKAINQHRRMLRGDQVSSRSDFRVLTRYGKELWADVNSVIITWEGKSATLNFATDITERKKAEETLSNERNLIANIMETSPVGITTVDTMGKITFANSKAIAILGLSKDEITQTTYNAPTWHISDIDGKPFPDDRLPFNIVMSSGKSVFDVQHAIQWPNGNRILLSINGASMKDANGQVNGMVASIEDITEHKKNEENYRTLFREMIDGFALHEIICDEEGLPIDYRFLAVNPAFERMTGLKSEELVGRTVLDVLPETERYWIETYGKVALTGEPAFFENYAVALGKHFEVTAFQSAPKQFACMFADITDRKRAEEEKSKLEAQLQQAQKMEAIGTLAGGIAHDFNNILAIISGYTEMAMNENQKEIWQQDLQEALRGVERAKNLVKQILTFSRQEDHEKKPLDIKVLLKEAIKFLRASIPTTIEISQQITEKDCTIMADPTQMHQVIMNLCTNASHAMKETGGTLKIELSNIELGKDEIPNHPEIQPGHYVKLSVSDTGYGIDPAIIQSIFDPFFTTKSVDEGTGLGLSVVYGIVKVHGGVINVYSEPGRGAAFHVYLPLIIQTETVGMDAGKPVIGGTERILFVDDEPSLVNIGMRMLFPLGYHVTGAASSKEALDIFRAEPHSFDLVITDMTLPKMTGIDLSRKLLQIRPDIPIILCSGTRESDTEAQVKSLGIQAYLTKPLTKRELSLVIREVLDGKDKKGKG